MTESLLPKSCIVKASFLSSILYSARVSVSSHFECLPAVVLLDVLHSHRYYYPQCNLKAERRESRIEYRAPSFFDYLASFCVFMFRTAGSSRLWIVRFAKMQ